MYGSPDRPVSHQWFRLALGCREAGPFFAVVSTIPQGNAVDNLAVASALAEGGVGIIVTAGGLSMACPEPQGQRRSDQ